MAIRTAKEWGVPPLQVIRGTPRSWNRIDTRLSMAFVLLEQETCKDCGTVSWLGHSTDNRIVFKHDVAYCYGCMELERKRAEDAKAKKSDSHGAKPYVYPDSFDGQSPLPSRSDEYERRARRAQKG